MRAIQIAFPAPVRMTRAWMLWAVLALCAAATGPACAHVDRILPVSTDGAIPDIPSQFGPVKVTVQGLGSQAPVVRLRIGAVENTVPLCATRLIRSKSMADLQVMGSWYHDEDRGLPYYISLHFFEPGRDRSRSFNSSVEFLFNLHDASLIAAKTFEAERSDQGGQYSRIDAAANCQPATGGRAK